MHNVSGTPKDWWAFQDGRFVPLGVCEDFDEADVKADEKAPGNTWIISREDLNRLHAQITAELEA